MTRQTYLSKCKRYAVAITPNGRDETCLITTALMNDGQSYGEASFWFTIGTYKNLKNAFRAATKAMVQHNIEIDFPA